MSTPQIEGFGTPEATWSAWPGLAALPALAVSDLVPSTGRVIALAPHPDDEVLGIGGLLAQLSDQHRELLLIAVTDGTASHPGSATWTPSKLAAARPRETVEALRLLEIDADVQRLGLPDGAVADFEELLTRHLQEIVAEGDVVISTWREDAHPDHEAVGRAAAVAAAAHGALLLEVPIWMWHWGKPADPRVPWSRAVRVDLSEPLREAKIRAVQAYASQVQPDPALEIGAVLPPPHLERLQRPFEVLLRPRADGPVP